MGLKPTPAIQFSFSSIIFRRISKRRDRTVNYWRKLLCFAFDRDSNSFLFLFYYQKKSMKPTPVMILLVAIEGENGKTFRIEARNEHTQQAE